MLVLLRQHFFHSDLCSLFFLANISSTVLCRAPEPTSSTASARPQSASAATEEETHFSKRARFALESLNEGRRLDGLPPVSELPAIDIDATMESLSALPRAPSGDSDDSLNILEEYYVLELSDADEVFVASQKKKPDVAMSRLSPHERNQFFDAKRSALDKQTQNGAWSPAPRSEAPAGTLVPMRFLLKWKTRPDGNTEANARVLFQGFKLAEVTSAPLDTQSPRTDVGASSTATSAPRSTRRTTSTRRASFCMVSPTSSCASTSA